MRYFVGSSEGDSHWPVGDPDALEHAMAPTRVKVRLKLQDPDGPAGETVWAEPTGEERYRLQSIPFAAYGYAEGDIVLCTWQDGWLEVVSTVSNSGNGTIRLLF